MISKQVCSYGRRGADDCGRRGGMRNKIEIIVDELQLEFIRSSFTDHLYWVFFIIYDTVFPLKDLV